MSKKKLNAKDLLSKRKDYDKTIAKYSDILQTENVLNKWSKRYHDLRKVLEQVEKYRNNRVKTKLYLQCLNLGLKSFNELPADCNYKTVFELSEMNEHLVMLEKIPYLDPAAKVKAKHRAKTKKPVVLNTEELSFYFLKEQKEKTMAKIKELEFLRDQYNENAELEVDFED